MKKLKWTLIALACFLAVFLIVMIVTYNVVFDQGGGYGEDGTEAENNSVGTLPAPLGVGTIEENAYVTRVTPGLNDAVVVKTLYTGKKADENHDFEIKGDEEPAAEAIATTVGGGDGDGEKPLVQSEEKQDTGEDDTKGKQTSADKKKPETKPADKTETKKPETKAEVKTETPKAAEQKTETPKAEVPKAEEEKKEEQKAEEAKAEEPKAEEPKVETPKTETPLLDPGKQYSDTGL